MNSNKAQKRDISRTFFVVLKSLWGQEKTRWFTSQHVTNMRSILKNEIRAMSKAQREKESSHHKDSVETTNKTTASKTITTTSTTITTTSKSITMIMKTTTTKTTALAVMPTAPIMIILVALAKIRTQKLCSISFCLHLQQSLSPLMTFLAGRS